MSSLRDRILSIMDDYDSHKAIGGAESMTDDILAAVAEEVERMPLVENPFPHHPYLNAHSPEREQEKNDNILHSAFIAGREAQRASTVTELRKG